MSYFCKSICDFPKMYQVPEFEVAKTSQGLRGTCVAFSVVALLNYLYRKQNKKFSTQFLYARCKQEDQDTAEGTSIENAFNCIHKYGVCQEKNWLYDLNDTEICTDENVLSKLPAESCADVNFQLLPSPRNIEEYKKILCGAVGNIPMPIVVGCSIFTSGCRENWLQEPFPGDKSEEGHAVLLYGWKDTPGLFSRGYFLAQNSLRTRGDNGSGELRVPFEYIEKYGIAAGTVIHEAEITEFTDNKESTIAAAEALTDRGNTIMQADREDMEISAIENNFFSTIKENIQKSPYFYPDLHLPFFKSLQINQVNVENVLRTEENCTNDFKRWLMAENIAVTKNMSVVLYWFKINSRNCWCLTCAFFAAQQGEAVTQDDINALQRYIEISCGCRPDTKHFFFTLGTNTKFSSACNVSAVPTVLLCEYRENNLWTHKVPMFERGQVGDEFLAHIMPGQYKKKIEEIIYGWNKISDPQITVKRIRERMGASFEDLDLKTVELTLDSIFADGGYARKKDGCVIPYELWGGKPSGAKKCLRYTTSIGKLKTLQTSLLRITILLYSLVVIIQFSTFTEFTFPKWTTIIVPIICTILFVIKEFRLRLKFKYNIN